MPQVEQDLVNNHYRFENGNKEIQALVMLTVCSL